MALPVTIGPVALQPLAPVFYDFPNVTGKARVAVNPGDLAGHLVEFIPEESKGAYAVLPNSVWLGKGAATVTDWAHLASVAAGLPELTTSIAEITPIVNGLSNVATVATGLGTPDSIKKAFAKTREFFEKRTVEAGLSVTGAWAKVGANVAQLCNGMSKYMDWSVSLGRKVAKEAFSCVSDLVEVRKTWYEYQAVQIDLSVHPTMREQAENTALWNLIKSVSGLALHATMLVGFVFAIAFHPLVATTLATAYLVSIAVSMAKESNLNCDNGHQLNALVRPHTIAV